MSLSPIRKHQGVGGKIYSHLRVEIDSLKDTCGNCEVHYELDWIVNENNVLRPDIALVCDETGDFISHPPIIVVEILSPSTALKDRQVKYEIYQENGVKYYIIVDPAPMRHRAYELKDGAYCDYHDTTFIIHDNCKISVDVAELISGIK